MTAAPPEAPPEAPEATPDATPAESALPPLPGRIDIHSHLLPGIDDGCRHPLESVECVRRLMAAGYVGTICTPHIWHEAYPANTIDHVRAWVPALQRVLEEHGLAYRLWAGGELRIFDGVIDWVKRHGVPTLAASRCVLMDFWSDEWPRWANGVFDWFLKQGYQPILAHPERLHCRRGLEACLDEAMRMGVWLQGNFRCMTGGEGHHADAMVRALLRGGRYRFLAMDLHRPDTLGDRLDGMRMVEEEFGRETLDRLTIDGPRRLVLGE